MLKYPEPALDEAFQALADPTRRGIVDRLTRGPASISQLANPLDMTLPAVMQHVAVLESSGLVRTVKVGRVRTCQVEPRTLRAVEQWLAERRTAWEQRLDRLEALLEDAQSQNDHTTKRAAGKSPAGGTDDEQGN